LLKNKMRSAVRS